MGEDSQWTECVMLVFSKQKRISSLESAFALLYSEICLIIMAEDLYFRTCEAIYRFAPPPRSLRRQAEGFLSYPSRTEESMSSLTLMRDMREKDFPAETVADALLNIQDVFPKIEAAYEVYLDDESDEDAQFRLQGEVADLAIAAQKILVILEAENLDWSPSPSLDIAISSRLSERKSESVGSE